MNLAASNIAWRPEEDDDMYSFLSQNKIEGLEIAPTRVLGNDPYFKMKEADDFRKVLCEKYGLKVVSLQSIWYGISANMFNTKSEREFLLDYTKHAIDFAAVLGAENLVFGCPRNRVIQNSTDIEVAKKFFFDIGEYALKMGTKISLEANPTIYHTNFMNYTYQSFEMAKMVSSEGCKVNLDIGTIIFNKETLDIVKDNLRFINHIHISEPYLVPIQKRMLHRRLLEILDNKYKYYISVEMGQQSEIAIVKESILYMKGVFK